MVVKCRITVNLLSLKVRVRVEFSKYEGLGNDFVVIERPEIDARDAKKICDRRLGIGADGVLLLEPGAVAPYRMTVWNADGSNAEMCGNGLRCIVRHLQRTVPDLTTRFSIETGAGLLWVSWDHNAITAELGTVVDHGPLDVDVDESTLSGRLISTGNPHFVLFGKFEASYMAHYGPLLETLPIFPDGVNVSFARRLSGTSVELTVWERGCGLTQACGTGACATVVAGWLESKLEANSAVQVDLPGGSLEISGAPENIIMRGPANFVFSGVWPSST
jgi:diaminopimelate epimerase